MDLCEILSQWNKHNIQNITTLEPYKNNKKLIKWHEIIDMLEKTIKSPYVTSIIKINYIIYVEIDCHVSLYIN